MREDVIALFEFEQREERFGEAEEPEAIVTVIEERHYRLVPPEEMTPEDLRLYNTRSA